MRTMPKTKEERLDRAVSALLGAESLVRGLPPGPERERADLHIGLAREALGSLETEWEGGA